MERPPNDAVVDIGFCRRVLARRDTERLIAIGELHDAGVADKWGRREDERYLAEEYVAFCAEHDDATRQTPPGS